MTTKKSKIHQKSQYSPNMYLLAFMDAVERLDILLLEIRHLQQSIIYLLRTPALYRPLRYEGDYIFGNWSEFAGDKSSRAFDTFTTSQAIIRYPSPRKAVEFFKKVESGKHVIFENKDKDNTTEDRDYTIDVLNAKIGEIWLGDQWVRELRRHYYALRSLQVLKQQIFRDKVSFFREAKSADLLNKQAAATSSKLPALMVLRSGIMFRINRYLSILQTHQQNFNKSVSYGIQGFPRPTTERRRQLGVFSDFLSETTVNLNKEMGHLLNEIMPEHEIAEHRQTRPLHIHVLHGWSPDPRVSSNQLYDNIGRTEEIKPCEPCESHGEKRGDKVEDTYYIDSSFWSPDCPAHQALITKEIASLYIRNLLGNMDDGFLSNSDSDLAFLMRSLFKQINETTLANISVLEPLNQNIYLLIKDLSKDFLSASIKGIPYIYAIFLANLGKGLESVLMHQGVIRLDRLHELHDGCRSISDYFSWYFRLRLTCFWMQQIIHTPCHHLDKIILEGCREVCDEIIRYLDKCTPPTREPVGYLWRRLGDKLEDIIENSPLVLQVHQWRKKRSKDKWNETYDCAGDRKYYRSVARLDIHLQNYLFRKILKNKTKEGKPLYDFNKEDYIKGFSNYYKIKIDDDILVPRSDKIYLQHPRWLFRHLYDIPFQCSAIRSMDFLSGRQNTTDEGWKNFVHECHYDMSLGRDLFSKAMEFHIWSHESPRSRLSIIINLLEQSFSEIEEEKSSFEEDLNNWLHGSNRNNYYSANTIKKNIENIQSAEELRRKCTANNSWLDKYPAVEIAASFAYISKAPQVERRMEQLCGYKLQNILRMFGDSTDMYTFDKYRSMYEYLKIHDSCKTTDDNNKHLSNRFYSTLLESFGDNYFPELYKQDKENKEIIKQKSPTLPETIPAIMINRIIASNHYPLQKKRDYDRDDLSLIEYFDQPLTEEEPLEVKRNARTVYRAKHIAVLGSHDGLLFSSIKVPCKCPIFSIRDSEDKRKFFTHFALREIAQAVKILPDNTSDSPKYALPKKVLGTITISLNRREMRLNLLYRLYKAYQEERAISPEKYNDNNFLKAEKSTIENAIKHFYHQNKIFIQGFLTDGWGDLILVFQVKENVEATPNMVKDIFTTQQILYNEFMVDRTEVMLTPSSFDAAFKKNNKDFQLTVHLRQQEDRRLGPVMTGLINEIKERAKEDKSVELLSLYGVPSNNIDLSLRLKVNIDDSTENPYKRLIRWMKGGGGKMMQNIDRIETLIENCYPT